MELMKIHITPHPGGEIDEDLGQEVNEFLAMDNDLEEHDKK